jgi:hypothetical protein
MCWNFRTIPWPVRSRHLSPPYHPSGGQESIKYVTAALARMGPAGFYQLTTRLSPFQLQYDHFDRALGKLIKI